MKLHMTELGTVDWPRAVAWYRDVLGLPVQMIDEARGFALLGHEGGRIALKTGVPASGVKLSFEAGDLESARANLLRRGADPGPIVEDPTEGFRSFRVAAPGGVRVQVFSWGRGDRSSP